MKIRISNLLEGMNEWEEALNPSDLELDTSKYPDSVSVHYTVERLYGRLNISILVKSTGVFICNRCGEDFSTDVNGEAEVQYILRDSMLPDEMPGDDLRSYSELQKEIDVSPELRDALILSLPMKVLCSEDCKGVCSGCGANLNKEECHCEIDED